MNASIKVARIDHLYSGGGQIEVDRYVPLRYLTGLKPTDTKYLIYGDLGSTLLEIKLDSQSVALSGFTLTAFRAVHVPNLGRALPRCSGLPVISITPSFGTIGASIPRRTDVRGSISVGLGSNFLEIDFGKITAADQIAVDGRAEFFLFADSLVGICVVDLDDEQLLTLRSFREAEFELLRGK